MLLDTPVCNFGWKAPDFKLPTADGQLHKRGDLVGANGLLVAFICNHCPYVKAIIQNFVLDAQKLEHLGINTVAIMPNDFVSHPADSPEKMLDFAKEHAFKFPYLVDEEQSVARAYDAVCTPDFFGFNAKLELQYRGRLDNLTMGKDEPRNAELFDAMTIVAETQCGPEKQFASMGCSIKWK